METVPLTWHAQGNPLQSVSDLSLAMNNGGGGGGARILIAAVIAIFSVGGYFFSTQTNAVTGQKQHVSISTAQESAMGQQEAPQMAQQFGGLDPDAAAQKLVSDVGTGIQAHSDAAKAPVTIQYFLLADKQTINAFALPGGPVFITRALLRQAPDARPARGRPGPRDGHVAARHTAQQMAKQKPRPRASQGAAVVGTSDSNNYYQHSAEAPP